MVTVRFYGDLKQFGSSFKMDVASVPEALRALMTQITGLREHIEKGHYKVTADGKQLTADTLETGLEKTLHITPVTKGAGKNMAAIGQIIVGIVMIAASFYTGGATAVAYFASGAGMILGGIAQLLTKMPQMDSMKDSDDLKSSSFSNLLLSFIHWVQNFLNNVLTQHILLYRRKNKCKAKMFNFVHF